MKRTPPRGPETALQGLSLPAGAVFPPESHPALVYLGRLAHGSRRTLRAALDNIARLATSGRSNALSCNWPALRYQHTQAIRAALAARYAVATVNKHLAALRGVLCEAWKLGHMSADDYRAAANLPTVRGSSLPAGREVNEGELRRLFTDCTSDASAGGARDAALMAILYGGGLRRSEAVALDLADYDRDTGALTVRAGKGKKARVAYATNGSRAAVEAWLTVRGLTPGALLCPVNKGGKVITRRMSDTALLLILRRRAKRAGVGRFSPHDLRRSFVSHLLDAGADIASVQKLAGHANVQTTARYDRRPEDAKRKAAELLHVPYVAPEPAR